LGAQILADHVLEPVDGQCRFTQSVRYHGLIGAILGVLSGSLTREYMGIEAQGIKRQAESSSHAAWHSRLPKSNQEIE
jgi:hypothetical protein